MAPRARRFTQELLNALLAELDFNKRENKLAKRNLILAEEKLSDAKEKLAEMEEDLNSIEVELKMKKNDWKGGASAFRIKCGNCDVVYKKRGNAVPRLMDCGHTMCTKCLEKLQGDELTVDCLFCDSEHKVRPVEQIRINRDMIEYNERQTS